MAKTLKQKKSLTCSTICHAWCCRNITVVYNGLLDKDTEQFFMLRGIVFNPLTKEISIPAKCKWVTNQNKCKLYSWRPISCRVYECDKLKSISIDS